MMNYQTIIFEVSDAVARLTLNRPEKLNWRCVEDAELAAVVGELVKQLAVAPTHGLARTKQALYDGVRAFIGKRTPRFTGQ